MILFPLLSRRCLTTRLQAPLCMLSDLTWYENILVIPPLVALGIGTLAFVTSGVVIFKVSGPLRQHADLLLTGTQDLSLQSPKDYLRTYWPLLSYELLVLIPLLMYTIAFEVRGMVVGGDTHTHTPVMFQLCSRSTKQNSIARKLLLTSSRAPATTLVKSPKISTSSSCLFSVPMISPMLPPTHGSFSAFLFRFLLSASCTSFSSVRIATHHSSCV